MGLNNLKPWPKGVSGNPTGNRRLPPEIRLERKRNQASLIRLVMSGFNMTREQVAAKLRDEGITQLERAVHGVMLQAVLGDVRSFEYLTELICGKIPQEDLEDPSSEMTIEEKLEVMRRAVALLESQVKKDEPGGA